MHEQRPLRQGLDLDTGALARFMPMYLLLDAAGLVIATGPTLARVLQGAALPGTAFEDLFEVRAPGGAVTIGDVLDRAGRRFRLVARNAPQTGLRGLGQRLADGRILINLSFGIDLISAVRAHGLTDDDFAATDLAMELLYMAEANAAVTRELRGLNLRLDGARLAAEEEALTDPLTGLRNRRAVDLLLERLCAAHAGIGLLQLDLDYFKSVNDTLGHAAGDEVLERVGRILDEETRVDDCAARIGGDEFVIIVSGRVEMAVLQAMAERIIARISQPMEYQGEKVLVSASVGIVRSADMLDPTPAQLLAQADRALYAAKGAGRARAVALTERQG